jgi:hypothetical protein
MCQANRRIPGLARPIGKGTQPPTFTRFPLGAANSNCRRTQPHLNAIVGTCALFEEGDFFGFILAEKK